MKTLIYGLITTGLLCGSAFAAKPQTANDDVEYLLYMGQDRLIVFKLHLRVEGKSYRKIYVEQTDKFFNELDANKDGVLTGKEINGVPSQTDFNRSSPFAARSRRLPTVSKNLIDSAPRDGKVTRMELRIYLKRIGYAPFSLQISTGNQNPNARYVYVGQARGDEAGKKLFTLLDTNDDGKLSAAELKAAGKSLRKTDFDDDGTISSAELGPVQSPYGGLALMNNRNRTNNTEFLSLTSNSSPSPTMVRKLITKYDKPESGNGKTAGSANRKLSRRELHLEAAAFSKYDRDGDGNLDSTELRYFLRKPPAHVEMIMRLGKLKKGEKLIEIVRVDKGMKSIVKRVTDKLANLRLAASQLDIGNAGGSYRTTQFATASYDRQFKAADTDNNGYITREESRRYSLFSQNFDQMDTDKDGKVFKKEMHAYIRRQSSLAQSRTVLSINDQGRDLFRILDLNRDNRLSRQELTAALDRIEAWDNDSDKQIAKSEIPRQYRMTANRGRPGGGALLVTMAAPYRAGARVRRTSVGPRWFQRMDLNGDGEVAQREFIGPLRYFKKLDKDGDKHISLAEANAAPVVKRAQAIAKDKRKPSTAPKSRKVDRR